MRITIKVPATSANLGPGFDTLGLALDLWNESAFYLSDDFVVEIEGEGKDRLPSGKTNMIIRAAQGFAEHVGRELPPFHARCVNHIPTGSGLGSSAAATLTGLLAANALTRSNASEDEVLRLATEIEGHPDNTAPALLGGLVAATLHGQNVIARNLPMAPMHITLVLPDFHFPTREARNSLPQQISVQDAVHNISRAVLLTEAFRTGDLTLLGEAMDDRLHQPYRLRLIPGAASALQAAQAAGAAGAALSGAGPSLIAFSANENPQIGEAMQRAFQNAGLPSRVFNLKASGQGASVVVEHE